MIAKLLIGFILLILGILTLCAWIHLDPPASVLLTLPKMLYQAFIKPLLILLLVTQLILSAIWAINPANMISCSSFYQVTYFLIWVFILVGFFYCDLVERAPVKTCKDHYWYDTPFHKTSCTLEEKDLTALKSSKQFKLYASLEGSHKAICLLYLNYGGWSVHPTTTHTHYLRQLAINEGYSFAIYGGLGKEEGHIFDMVKDIKEAITTLKKLSYEKIILVGTSAGGHLALTTAFSDAYPKIYGEEIPQVDGVIALYPIVDLSESYVYFTCKEAATKSLLDHLGDKLYAAICKHETNTLSENVKLLYQQILGKPYEKAAALYECCSIKNMLTTKDIPIFIIHGNHDSNAPCIYSRQLYKYLVTENKNISYLELPNTEHAFDMINNHSIATDKSKREIRLWLNTYFH